LGTFDFYENYIDISFNVNVLDIGPESEKLREVSMEGAKSISTSALELLIDENIVNTILAEMYTKDASFKLREAFGAHDPEDTYGAVVDQVLKT